MGFWILVVIVIAVAVWGFVWATGPKSGSPYDAEFERIEARMEAVTERLRNDPAYREQVEREYWIRRGLCSQGHGPCDFFD